MKYKYSAHVEWGVKEILHQARLQNQTLRVFNLNIYVIMDHKTSHRVNKLSIDVWFVMIGQYLKIWNLRVQKNLNIEKIIFKVVQMKFLAMHITN